MANFHIRPFSKASRISGLPALDLAAAALAAGEEDAVDVARARVGVVEIAGGLEEGDAAVGYAAVGDGAVVEDVAFEERLRTEVRFCEAVELLVGSPSGTL